MTIFNQHQTALFQTHNLASHNLFHVDFFNNNPFKDVFIEFVDSYLYYVLGLDNVEIDKIEYDNEHGRIEVYMYFADNIIIEIKNLTTMEIFKNKEVEVTNGD